MYLLFTVGSLYRPSSSSAMAIIFNEPYIWHDLLENCTWAPMDVSRGTERRLWEMEGQYKTLWIVVSWEDFPHSRFTSIWPILGARIFCLFPRMTLQGMSSVWSEVNHSQLPHRWEVAPESMIHSEWQVWPLVSNAWDWSLVLAINISCFMSHEDVTFVDSFSAPKDCVDGAYLPYCLFFQPSLPPPSAQHCLNAWPGLLHLGFMQVTGGLAAFDFDMLGLCESWQFSLFDLANIVAAPDWCCLHFSLWSIWAMRVLVASVEVSVTWRWQWFLRCHRKGEGPQRWPWWSWGWDFVSKGS